MNAIVPVSNGEAFRASTDAAGLCKEIVVKTAKNIQGRKYVCVEGWQAIAIAHGCTASADHVERVMDTGMEGFRATGIVRRMSDGAEIARAEGFIGDDESVWSKRPVYARRAMVQTRAISRACRSAFAHVVVMLDAGLSTTPAEEVPAEGFDNGSTIEGNAGPADAKRAFPDGPCPGISNLKAAIRKMKDLGNACTSLKAFEQVVGEYRDHCRQLKALNHEWWTGEDREGNAFESVPAWVERRKAELSGGGGSFAMLIESMKECASPHDLRQWVLTNEEFIDSLTDADRRRWEAEYESFSAGLQGVATVTSG